MIKRENSPFQSCLMSVKFSVDVRSLWLRAQKPETAPRLFIELDNHLAAEGCGGEYQ